MPDSLKHASLKINLFSIEDEKIYCASYKDNLFIGRTLKRDPEAIIYRSESSHSIIQKFQQ